MTEPELRARTEGDRSLPYLVWPFAHPMTVASTAAAGGGIGVRHWVINAEVAHDYARRDLQEHAAELAAAAGLHGPGVTMLTAADVRTVRHGSDGGVRAAATVGITDPTWAAAPEAGVPNEAGGAAADTPVPGTINIVAFVPAPLSAAALLNALCTVTEAKAQALGASGIAATGTPSDAVTIACPTSGEEAAFAGPRSLWGARLARAVYACVLAGAAPWRPAGSGPDH